MNNLTDKWRKGELPSGWYYVKVIPDFEYSYDIVFYTGGDFELYSDKDIEQILAEVPSYESWKKHRKVTAETQIKNCDLEITNTKLKELLKECELWFTGVVGNMNDKNVGEHNRNLPIGNFEHIFKVFSQKINQVLGEE